MQLDKFGTKKWADATQKSILKMLAFIVNNKLIVAAKVNCQIANGVSAINRGEYSRQDIEVLKRILNK
jgi:preprotein translocase subunit SecD